MEKMYIVTYSVVTWHCVIAEHKTKMSNAVRYQGLIMNYVSHQLLDMENNVGTS
jgi:hypothetical protein